MLFAVFIIVVLQFLVSAKDLTEDEVDGLEKVELIPWFERKW